MISSAAIFQFVKTVASSEVIVKNIGTVKIFRRKGLKNIRLTLGHDGIIRLSIPWYVPRSAGLRFLNSKHEWIKKHQKQPPAGWQDGQKLANTYTLKIINTDKKLAGTALLNDTFEVHVPKNLSELQTRQLIDKRVVAFLKTQCELNLVPTLKDIAAQNGLKVNGVRIKKLKSRWGSCNQNKIINLNVMLVNLPADLAKYVLAHELAHTKHLNHGKEFWQMVEKIFPDYQNRRKLLKQYNPAGFF